MLKNFLLICLFCIFANAAQITDILDRKVEVKDDVKRVVLTFYFEEYFVTTGQKGIDNIVGWSKNYWAGRREATWQAFLSKFPQMEKIPDIGYIGKNNLSFEKIVSLNPDIVIFASNDYEKVKNDLQRLQSAKIPAIFIDFHDENLQNHIKSMEILGEIFNEKEKISEVNEYYISKFKMVENRLAKVENLKKPKVYVEFSAKEGALTFGPTYDDKMWGAFINLAGGENIAKGLVKGVSAAINPEFVISKNPDVIIFAGNYFANSYKNIPLGYGIGQKQAKANYDDYAGRKGWNRINAIKNKNVFAIYHDLSRHIFDFAGVLFFAKAIHPEIFSDIDPNKELKEFFDKFYPVEFDGTWMIEF